MKGEIEEFLFALDEKGDHEAVTQVDMIGEFLDIFNSFLPSPVLLYYSISTIIMDTTSSNMGEHNGVRAVLEQQRKDFYLKQHGNVTGYFLFYQHILFVLTVLNGNLNMICFVGFTSLEVIPCTDHVMNLMSLDFEKELIWLS